MKLFGKKDPVQQAQLEQARLAVATQHDAMVRSALEQLAGWAFPGSRVETAGTGQWELVHQTESGERCVDVAVKLEFKKDRPVAFTCEHYRDGRGKFTGTLTLTRESLNEALRHCLDSR